MPITNLVMRHCYPESLTDLPVCIVMHGWSGDAADITNVTLQRLARRKLFAACVGMRGRDGASGTPDASAREIYDIYDAVTYIRTNFANIVSPDRALIVGYSGGGGNALAAACKFPDTWCEVISHFGMSDYGYDGTYGWYQVANYSAGIAARVGGTPAEVPDNYRARNALEALAINYTGGHLYMYHDTGDSAVPVHHSQLVRDALDNASLTNYTYWQSAAGDPTIRWIHDEAVDTTHKFSEVYWAQDAANRRYPAWTIAASGTVRVIGYIVTKRFAIWLGNGTSEVASVVYDTVAASYTVTPLTGSMDVTITQGVLSASQTISEETTINL